MKHCYTKIIALTIAACSLIACSDNEQESEIPVSEIPANIISIVQNTLPGISLTEAERKTKKDIVVYEIEGKLINGREYEIYISADGVILKIELED